MRTWFGFAADGDEGEEEQRAEKTQVCMKKGFSSGQPKTWGRGDKAKWLFVSGGWMWVNNLLGEAFLTFPVQQYDIVGGKVMYEGRWHPKERSCGQNGTGFLSFEVLQGTCTPQACLARCRRACTGSEKHFTETKRPPASKSPAH